MTGSYAYEWCLAYVESKGEAAGSGLTGVKARRHCWPPYHRCLVWHVQGAKAFATASSMCLPAQLQFGYEMP